MTHTTNKEESYSCTGCNDGTDGIPGRCEWCGKDKLYYKSLRENSRIRELEQENERYKQLYSAAVDGRAKFRAWAKDLRAQIKALEAEVLGLRSLLERTLAIADSFGSGKAGEESYVQLKSEVKQALSTIPNGSCATPNGICDTPDGSFATQTAQKVSGWLPIETAPTELVLIGREEFPGKWQYVHAAYLAGSEWFLPFDSDAGDDGQPLLADDELPTHWMPIPSLQSKEGGS